MHRTGISNTWSIYTALLFLLLICLLLMADINNQSGVFIPAKRTFFKPFLVYASWKQLPVRPSSQNRLIIFALSFFFKYREYNLLQLHVYMQLCKSYIHIHAHTSHMACVPHTTTHILYLQILIWIHKYLYFYHYKYSMYINFYLWIMFSRQK